MFFSNLEQCQFVTSAPPPFRASNIPVEHYKVNLQMRNIGDVDNNSKIDEI